MHFSKTQNVKAREIIKDKRWSASFWKKQEIFLQPKSTMKRGWNNAYGTGTTYSTSTYRTNAVFYMKGKS